MNLWDEATRDYEAELHVARMEAALAASGEYRKVLLGAVDRADLDNRLTVVAEALDRAAEVAVPEGGVEVAVIRTALQDAIVGEWESKALPKTAMGYASYGWLIDKDFTHPAERWLDHPSGKPGRAAGYSEANIMGPYNLSPEIEAQLRAGKGEAFQLYDGDGSLYYTGRWVPGDEESNPLDDYGTPAAGCTKMTVGNSQSYIGARIEANEEYGYDPVTGESMEPMDGEVEEMVPEPEPVTAARRTAKAYDLGFGFLGNGLTVWNRAEERNNDYVTVAHISPEGVVTYREELPEDIRAQIESMAEREMEAYGWVGFDNERAAREREMQYRSTAARHSAGNAVAEEGVTRCPCGSKYWENDECADCGEPVRKSPKKEGRMASRKVAGVSDWEWGDPLPSIDEMVAALPQRVDLVYISRGDSLSPEQLVSLFQTGEMDASLEDFISEAQWEGVKYELENALGSDLYNEISGTDAEDTLREILWERDQSDPIRDLARGSGQVAMRYALGIEFSNDGHTIIAEEDQSIIDELAAALGANSEQVKEQIATIVAQSYSHLVAYIGWDEDASAVYEWSYNPPSSLSWSNPTLLLLDPYNGSGWAEEVSVNVTKPFDRSRMSFDYRGVAGGYSWNEVVGQDGTFGQSRTGARRKVASDLSPDELLYQRADGSTTEAVFPEGQGAARGTGVGEIDYYPTDGGRYEWRTWVPAANGTAYSREQAQQAIWDTVAAYASGTGGGPGQLPFSARRRTAEVYSGPMVKVVNGGWEVGLRVVVRVGVNENAEDFLMGVATWHIGGASQWAVEQALLERGWRVDTKTWHQGRNGDEWWANVEQVLPGVTGKREGSKMARKVHAMPEIHEVEIYSAKELQQVNPSGFEQAMYDLDIWMWESGITQEYIEEEFQRVLWAWSPSIAAAEPKMNYDLSATQGSGVIFPHGFRVTPQMARELYVSVPKAVTEWDYGSGIALVVENNDPRYSHEYMMHLEAEVWPYWTDTDAGKTYYFPFYNAGDDDAIAVPKSEQDALYKYGDDVREALRSLCRELERVGREMYSQDYGALIDFAEANDMMFYEDGRRF